MSTNGESANSAEVAARPVSLTPPLLAWGNAGSSLSLSWPADHIGWRLEWQTNAPGLGLSMNWVAIPGSASTNRWSIPASANYGSVFIRLAYP